MQVGKPFCPIAKRQPQGSDMLILSKGFRVMNGKDVIPFLTDLMLLLNARFV